MKKIHATIVTYPGVASNNRGENQGNLVTMKKIIWPEDGQVHTMVSGDAIRAALRDMAKTEQDAADKIKVNRGWNDDHTEHQYADENRSWWEDRKGTLYFDDDVFGFMITERQTGARSRKGALDVNKAVSLSPYDGNIEFNSRGGRRDNTSLHNTEIHATRYQYSISICPYHLERPKHVVTLLKLLVNLHSVGGNHSRASYDFSPESIVLRYTHPNEASRIQFCFNQEEDGTVRLASLDRQLASGDVDPNDVVVGGPAIDTLGDYDGLTKCAGTKEAVKTLIERLSKDFAANSR